MKISKLKDNYLEFDNGYTIEGIHEQDCCEYVYADFEYLNTINFCPRFMKKIKITDVEFEDDIENNIELEKEMGFKLISTDGSKWFVPCYNEQNGYYNSCLELKIKKGVTEIIIDISECVEDNIYD